MNLNDICNVMQELGAETLYFKCLAENDNSKNQIYMGGNFAVINIFPFQDVVADTTTRKHTIKAKINLHWIDPETRQTEQAKGSQLILYPQYPEVRLSGFLKGCLLAPSAYMQPIAPDQRKNNKRADGRILFFGICADGCVLSWLAHAGSDVANECFQRITEFEQTGVFYQVPLITGQVDTRTSLMARLTEIHQQGWHTSRRLDKDGNVIPYKAANGGGYTLEALFNIIPNGRSEPDFEGWELKAYSGSVLTLMTPEPTGGFYGKQRAAEFLRKYGVPKQNDSTVLYFTGTHYAGKRHQKTEMTLTLTGFHASKGTFDVTGGIELIDRDGEVAAAWDYASLIKHWNKKHQQTAYIPYVKREMNGGVEYQYGSPVTLGINTDFSRFLLAVNAGFIYYDPAPKLTGIDTDKPKVKARSQFRIKFKDLIVLYMSLEKLDIK